MELLRLVNLGEKTGGKNLGNEFGINKEMEGGDEA